MIGNISFGQVKVKNVFENYYYSYYLSYLYNPVKTKKTCIREQQKTPLIKRGYLQNSLTNYCLVLRICTSKSFTISPGPLSESNF